MAVTFRAAHSATAGAVTDPGSAGDFLVALCSNDQGSSVTAPDGTWTQRDLHDVGGDGQRWAVYTKDSSAGTGATLNFNNVGATIVAAFSGADSTAPFAGIASQDDSALNTTTVRSGNLTPTANGCTIVWAVGIDNGGGDGGTSAAVTWMLPSGYTKAVQADAQGENIVIAYSNSPQGTATATGLISGTCSAAGQGPSGYTIAIKPAAGGGGTNTPMTISATQTQTPSLSRGVGASKAAAVSQAPTVSRAVAPVPKSSSQTQAPSLTKGQAFFRTASAVVTQTASRALGVGVRRAATATSSPILVARGLGRSLSAVALQVPSRARALSRALAAVQTQSGSSDQQQIGGGAHAMTLTATVTQTLALARAAVRQIAVTVAQTPVVARAVTPPARSATQTQTPSVTKGQSHFVTASAVNSQAPSISRLLGVVRNAVATQAPTLTRGFTRQLTALVSQVGTVARGFFYSALAFVTQTPSEEHVSGEPAVVVPPAGRTWTPLREVRIFTPKLGTHQVYNVVFHDFDEFKDCGFDVSDLLDGDTLTSATWSSLRVLYGSASAALPTISSEVLAGTLATFWATGLVDGVTYALDLHIATSSGRLLTETITLSGWARLFVHRFRVTDPTHDLDYAIDAAAQGLLAGGELIDDVDWSDPVVLYGTQSPVSVTGHTEQHSSTVAKKSFTGIAPGVTYIVKVTLTTTSGRAYVRKITLAGASR